MQTKRFTSSPMILITSMPVVAISGGWRKRSTASKKIIAAIAINVMPLKAAVKISNRL